VSDPHWLVKDFHVLYRTALVDPAIPDSGTAVHDFEALQVQLARLKPAFDVCEAERRASAPVPFVLRGAVPVTAEQAARFRDVSGLSDVSAERLTPAERKALNALHRWLHSPVGDDALIEEAQDYHEQVEAEGGTEDCNRLEQEERIAWANGLRMVDVEPLPGPGVCRVCKCTDDDCSRCVEKTGVPCHWIEPDLCSACEAGATP
jgi:hypothetical protein